MAKNSAVPKPGAEPGKWHRVARDAGSGRFADKTGPRPPARRAPQGKTILKHGSERHAAALIRLADR